MEDRRIADIAWAAGLFEGEGYFSATIMPHPRGSYRSVIAGLNMTDEDVVKRFADIIGFGAIYTFQPRRPDGSDYKLSWRWRTRRAREASAVAEMLMPWLGARRREAAQKVIEMGAQIGLRRSDRTHCPRGHAYDFANTYIDRDDGSRECRACNRDRVQAFRARQRRPALHPE